MSGDRPVLLGVLLYVGIAVAPTVLLWASVRYLPALLDLPALIGRLGRLVRPPAPPTLLPVGQTFESLVRDLHRLRREVVGRQPTTRVRRVALLAAYDDVLHDMCRAVGVDRGPLSQVPERERPFARLQIEAALEEAGVLLEPPKAGPAAA
ncbi:hypothetical protein GCM10009836_21580 [Pseudonocardia ailaonensis]|uniref:DUF4129 domain-containing protein n=1 Tax=Pseudonocardia ailaonensis TaxID=367279 RepID=A0ABN2MZZ6_9PSEU